MSSEDQKGIITPAAIGAEIGAKLFNSSDKPARSEVSRRPLSDDQQQAKEQLEALLVGAKKNSPKPQDSPAVAATSDPVINTVDAASIPTPPPLPETFTAEQKKARRAAQEEKRRVEQEKYEEDKKSIEGQTTPSRKNSMGPVIDDSFRAAMAARNAKMVGEDDGDDWDEDDDALVSVSKTSTIPKATMVPASPLAQTASMDMPAPSQEQIQTPEASVKSESVVTSNEVKTDGRAALLQAIRDGVKLKKQDVSKEQGSEASRTALVQKTPETTPKLPGDLLAELAKDNKAALKSANVKPSKPEETSTGPKVDTAVAPTKETVSVPKAARKPNVLDELQQNARFKKAKGDSENQVVKPAAPAVEVSNRDPGKNEWNRGFNRIRQRNIPFQYVPEADLKKGIEAFNQKKAAKANPGVVEIEQSMPKPAVVSEPQRAAISKPASTVDTDRDYALALHLDELQRSPNASDRALADDPAYIRRLQETYDNNNKMDAQAFNQLNSHAQKEVRHQNLEQAPAVRPKLQKSARDFYNPQASMLQAPRMQPQSRQAAQPAMGQRARELYVIQSVTFLMVTHMQISSFEASASASSRSSVCSASFFMASYTSICLSHTQSLSMGRDGSVSYSTSQSLSYTHMNLAVSDNGKGTVSCSTAAMAYTHHSRASSFFPAPAKEYSTTLSADSQQRSLNSLLDKVEPIGLPSIAMKAR